MIETLHADSREALAFLPSGSIDSVVTDPPYALVSIGKRFGADGSAPVVVQEGGSGAYARASAGFMGKTWDTGETAFAVGFWREVWRVLKPGGHVVAFGGTRSYHRLACAIEDAGFDIRDQLGWLYGTGFPKSHDVSKGLDKMAGAEREVMATGAPVKRMIPGADQHKVGWEKTNGREYQPGTSAPITAAAAAWDGWGTALKPAWEPIVLARKPLIGTVAQNVIQFGTGALNIDACRIEPDGRGGKGSRRGQDVERDGAHGVLGLRTADGEMEVAGKTVGSADDLRAGVSVAGDERIGQSELAGRGLDGTEVGIPTGQYSLPVADGSPAPAGPCAEGISRAPAGGGSPSRPAAPSGGACASHQRGEGRQQGREPDLDGLGFSFEGAPADGAQAVTGSGGERDAQGQDRETGVALGRHGEPSAERRYTDKGSTNFAAKPGPRGGAPQGRWPANIVHDGSDEVIAAFPDAPGALRAVTGKEPSSPFANVYGDMPNRAGGMAPRGDSGSAARFFYSAKASKADRNGSKHPTVKPVSLMRWLVRLVTPPGGVVLDPFAGSGTTGAAALAEGFDAILIEREAEYFADITRRLAPEPESLFT